MSRAHLVTTQDAAEQLQVPANRISAWRHRGLIQPVGLLPGRSGQGKGVALYDIDTLRPLADRYHARRDTQPEPRAGTGEIE